MFLAEEDDANLNTYLFCNRMYPLIQRIGGYVCGLHKLYKFNYISTSLQSLLNETTNCLEAPIISVTVSIPNKLLLLKV